MDDRKNKGRWRPGESGNPKGKPAGSGKLQRLRENIAEHVPAIIERLAAAARDGDVAAARLLLERALPSIKPIEHPQCVAMPKGGTLTDCGRAVLDAVGTGAIGPATAAQLITALGSVARLVELDELMKRVDQLEQKLGQNHDGQKP